MCICIVHTTPRGRRTSVHTEYHCAHSPGCTMHITLASTVHTGPVLPGSAHTDISDLGAHISDLGAHIYLHRWEILCTYPVHTKYHCARGPDHTMQINPTRTHDTGPVLPGSAHTHSFEYPSRDPKYHQIAKKEALIYTHLPPYLRQGMP